MTFGRCYEQTKEEAKRRRKEEGSRRGKGKETKRVATAPLGLSDSKFLFGTGISLFSFDSLIHGIDNLTKGNGSSSFSISNRHV